MLKVLILGDSGVGKTALMNQFVRKKFSATYKATIGADFLTKELELDGMHVTMQIWDTAGQERFQSLGQAFYRGADCVVLVHDLTNFKSFEALNGWRREFLTQTGAEEPFPFVVLGNKSDLNSQLSRTNFRAYQKWCKENGAMPHYMTSAKNASNVNQAFEEIGRIALSREEKDRLQFVPAPTSIKVGELNPDRQPPADSCAC